MLHFIHLTSRVINKLHIIEIVKKTQTLTKPNKYLIHMNTQCIHGTIIMSSGWVASTPNIIEICETDDPCDYIAMTQWIKTDFK